MDHLWSPWRYRYVTKAAPPGGCVFCLKAASSEDETNLVVYRGRFNYVLLNLFPYTDGHLMVAPYEHIDSLAAVSPEAAGEMMELARRAEMVLRTTYHPGGINIGMNLGECAGAGIAGHIHLHMLPRWPGDANFMTTVAETRVHIEDLAITWARLRAGFAE